MRALKRYNELLFIADTCQAFTMGDEITSPNVYSVGSSLKDQNSYASHSDNEVGLSVIDRYSKALADFVDDAAAVVGYSMSTSIGDDDTESGGAVIDPAATNVMERTSLYDALVRIPTNFGNLGGRSAVGNTDALCARKMSTLPLSDFFSVPAWERRKRSERKEHGVVASLWMQGHGTSTGVEGGDKIFAADDQCQKPSVEGSEITRTAEDSILEKEKPTQQRRNPRSETDTGMSPSDPKFVAMVLVFIFGVRISSQIW